MSSLTALHHLTVGHVFRLSLRLILKLWPSQILHHGRLIFPIFQENLLYLNFRMPELAFSCVSTGFRINLDEEDVKCLRNTSTYIL